MRAHVYTRTSTVATLVGWQVNKVNSLVWPLSILHCKRKGCSYTAQPTLINNYEYVGLQIEHSDDKFCKTNHFEANPSCYIGVEEGTRQATRETVL